MFISIVTAYLHIILKGYYVIRLSSYDLMRYIKFSYVMKMLNISISMTCAVVHAVYRI